MQNSKENIGTLWKIYLTFVSIVSTLSLTKSDVLEKAESCNVNNMENVIEM